MLPSTASPSACLLELIGGTASHALVSGVVPLAAREHIAHAVGAPEHVEEAAEDGHSREDAAGAHGRHSLPLAPCWLVALDGSKLLALLVASANGVEHAVDHTEAERLPPAGELRHSAPLVRSHVVPLDGAKSRGASRVATDGVEGPVLAHAHAEM
eukprot:CAMPEP_0183338092 /NCGR_PEP_ID=MMETSP0164_2-20130417/5507_1 /TAXON_ID=221442 /ORGANISM="Coccolithus pelagicus ssp braarudi, Strain PLY182g" /LENGTH=155 /DNA_ID=CAMNT_0025507887 /DNA_START=550 /DNA_END=1016 /DNA_ORIENTATION=-